MSLQLEKLEKSMAKLTIEVPAEELEKAIEKAYQKQKKNISVPGFRKGKVPRQLVEKMYGPSVFYEEAANELIPDNYDKAADECGEEIVSQPKIEVVQIEKGKPFIFTAEVALKPEIKLGKYKGVKVDKVDLTVSDEEVEAEIDAERQKNARVVAVERPVQDGDEIMLDFDGSVDGVAFAGGKSENYPLTVGSGSFIPGFEEQLVGAKKEEELEVKVTFPEDYHAEELKGKEAVFKCMVHEIKERQLPDLDDEFASEVSEFETVAEYKEDVKKKLAEKKENEAKAKKEDQALGAIIDDSEIEIPEAMLETQARQAVNEFAQRLQMQGMNIEQYMQYTGMTVEAMMEQMKPSAEARIKSRLVLDAVATAEKVEVSDEEFEEEVAKMAKEYGMEADQVKTIIGEKGKKDIIDDLRVSKAADIILENVKETKPRKSSKKEAAAEPVAAE